MRVFLLGLLVAGLSIATTGCDDGGGTKFDVTDSGGSDLVADTVAPDVTGDLGLDSAADADSGPVTPPECQSVACGNGGACVVQGGSGVCECPPGTDGAGCETLCPAAPLTIAACSSLAAPGVWWHGPAAEDCGTARLFKLTAAGASEVLLSGDFNGWAPTAATATALTDADGDGGWETSIALPPGEHRYKFIVDGVAQADPGNPFNEPDGAGGTQSVLTAGDCAQADAGGPGCRWLFAAGGSLSHHCASPKTGCAASADCPDGCVSDVWIAVDLGARRAVTDLRFRSDWWAKRPKGWELWVSDSMLRGPQTGATLVTTGSGQQAPWQCVTGEACSSEVPADECCPNGAAQPQQIPDGALISKYDDTHLPPAAGRFVWFNIADTYDPTSLLFEDLQLQGNDCIPGAPAPTPTPCAPNPCFAGVTCTVTGGATYSCGPCPAGTAGDGETCTEIDGCADAPCFPAVTCTDHPAPDTGFTCGPCPTGFTGNGKTCAPDLPPECVTAGDCNANGTQSCSGGKCVTKSCSGQSQCGSGYCFKGKCAIGAGSCEAACTQAHGNNTWLCDGSGYCQVRNCSSSKPCPSGQECVSRFNNSFGPGGSSTSAYGCESDGSSPCNGACSSSQVCSSESQPPKCFP
ncbi:MAG: glycogen-binding domain-containing protein [Myxococcota bacterium]